MSVKNKASSRREATAGAKERARRFGVRLQGAAREGVVILLLAACVFLLLAMFSYQASDPGWSHSGPDVTVNNWMASSSTASSIRATTVSPGSSRSSAPGT